jgi:hypothetical protein
MFSSICGPKSFTPKANDLKEVIQLVASTPCARAKGAIEIRQIISIKDADYAPSRA